MAYLRPQDMDDIKRRGSGTGLSDRARNVAQPIQQAAMPQQVMDDIKRRGSGTGLSDRARNVAGQEPAAGRYANYTSPPADDGINFARIGRGLSGLGAGIQGRGAEFSKGLREDRAQQQKLREEALITDTMYSKRALDSGNMPAFLKRMESRIDAGIKMGMDMTDSVRLYNLAETDPEAAKAQVNAGYQNLVDRGLVDAPEAYNLQTKKVKNPVTGKLEMLVFDPRTGKVVGESLGEATGDGTTVNVNANNETSFMKKIGQEQAASIVKKAEEADIQFKAADSMSESAAFLNSGQLISGTAGDFRLSLAKGLNLMGVDKEDYISNTEAFFAAQGRQVMDIITAFGSGTGLSDADRQYASKIAGGDISLNEQSIRKITDIRMRSLTAGLDSHNKRIAKVVKKHPELDGMFEVYDIPEFPNVLPVKNPPPKALPNGNPNPRRAIMTETGQEIISVPNPDVKGQEHWTDLYGNPITIIIKGGLGGRNNGG